MQGEDRFAAVSDPDIQAVVASSDETTVSVASDVICITHPVTNDFSDESVTMSIGGLTVECGPIGSGKPYEFSRVSPTQTVIKRMTAPAGELRVSIGPGGIGFWRIGVNFVVS
jgi:hypothetical protein